MKSLSSKLTRLALSCTVGVLTLASAHGAGLLVADGGLGGVLEIKEHEVNVTINNGVAVTRVTQVFHNTEARQVEALYSFPVPKGASIAGFSMWINGKEMVGEVLEKKRAREIYNSYKTQRRDPGLLEQADYRTFEMRVFPIAPNADQKVQVTYYQELDLDHDWATYVYPLATTTRPNADTRTRGKFAINFEVKSAIPLDALESPSHKDAFAIARHTDAYYQASLETRGGQLDRDVVLAYHITRPKTGLDLITSRNDDEDGFFCLTLTAGEDLAKVDSGNDYVFLLDASGSMGADSKLVISRESIEAFINELGNDDRFEVMSFNVQPTTLFRELRPATAANRQQAGTFLDTREARGGTILNPALTTAYKYADPDRVLNVVILSDGLTEQQERAALADLIRQRPRNSRVFCIGVGNDVNKPLLEQLAQDSGGLASFLSRGDNFARQAKAFRRKLQHPVATDLALDIQGVESYDLEPKVLPNLYHGMPVRVYGRYRGTGPATVHIAGNIRGKPLDTTAKLDFPKQDAGNPEIERMWASRRIDRLAKNPDDAAITEIVRLGEAFSVTSEWTSFLVLENDAEYARWKIERRNVLRLARDRSSQEQLRARLETIRDRAAADLGPQPTQVASIKPTAAATPAAVPSVATPMNPAPASSPAPSRPSNQSWNIGGGGGSGPVGPLFVIVTGWLMRRKNRKG